MKGQEPFHGAPLNSSRRPACVAGKRRSSASRPSEARPHPEQPGGQRAPTDCGRTPVGEGPQDFDGATPPRNAGAAVPRRDGGPRRAAGAAGIAGGAPAPLRLAARHLALAADRGLERRPHLVALRGHSLLGAGAQPPEIVPPGAGRRARESRVRARAMITSAARRPAEQVRTCAAPPRHASHLPRPRQNFCTAGSYDASPSPGPGSSPSPGSAGRKRRRGRS